MASFDFDWMKNDSRKIRSKSVLEHVLDRTILALMKSVASWYEWWFSDNFIYHIIPQPPMPYGVPHGSTSLKPVFDEQGYCAFIRKNPTTEECVSYWNDILRYNITQVAFVDDDERPTRGKPLIDLRMGSEQICGTFHISVVGYKNMKDLACAFANIVHYDAFVVRLMHLVSGEEVVISFYYIDSWPERPTLDRGNLGGRGVYVADKIYCQMVEVERLQLHKFYTTPLFQCSTGRRAAALLFTVMYIRNAKRGFLKISDWELVEQFEKYYPTAFAREPPAEYNDQMALMNPLLTGKLPM